MSSQPAPTPTPQAAPESTTSQSIGGSTPAPSAPSAGPRGGRRVQLKVLSYKEASQRLSPTSSQGEQVAQQGLSGSGSAPDAGIASRVESATGTSVSHASVRSDPAAQEACKTLGAEAYTYGSDVALSSPNVPTSTVAHELAHVAQQTGQPSGQTQMKSGGGGSGNLESEADNVATAALSGGQASVTAIGGQSVQRKPDPALNGTEEVKSDQPPPDPAWVTNDTEAAQKTHKAELQQLIRYLKGSTRKSDVTGCLQILRNYDLQTIVGMWNAVWAMDAKGEWLDDILSNLHYDHMKSYPREVTGTILSANLKWRWQKLVDLTSTGFLNGVSDDEAAYGYLILKDLPQAWIQEFQEKFPKHAGQLYANLEKSTRTKIDAAVDPAQEKKLRDAEMAKRKDVAAGEAYMASRGTDAKNTIEADLKWVRSRLSDKEDAVGILNKLVGSLRRDGSGTELGLFARAMEETNKVNWWLEKLKPANYPDGEPLRAFLHILRRRPPEAALKTCEELLSTGFLGLFPPNAAEAKLAYDIIRMQPPTVQKRLRELDNGKFLERMETKLGTSVVTDKNQFTLDAKGQLATGGFGTASSDAEAQRNLEADKLLTSNEGGSWDRFMKLVGELEKGVTPTNAKTAYQTLGAEGLQVRQAMVRRLDALNVIESIMNKLGFDFIWSEENRLTTVGILHARDPMRSVAHIQRLLDRGIDLFLFYTGSISAAEAYYAANLMKALPPEYRKRVQEQNPEWWGLITGNLNASQKGQEDLNFYGGGEGGADRISILSQLTTPDLWTGPEAQLENVAKMAAAAGHRKLVYDTAKSMNQLTAKKALLVKLKICDEKGDYTANNVNADGKVAEVGFFQKVGAGGRLLGNALTHSNLKEGSITNVNLNDVQTVMGGSVSGIKFAKPTTEQEKNRTNRVDLTFQRRAGTLDLTIPGLAIESVAMQSGETTLKTGPLSTGLVKIKATFPTEQHPEQAASFSVLIEDPIISELLLVAPGSMVAAKRISLKRLSVRMSEMPALAKDVKTPAEAEAAVKNLLPAKSIQQAIWEFISLYDLRSIGSKATENLTGAVPPAFKGPGGIELIASELNIEGLTTSGGFHADKISVAGDMSVKVDNLRSEAMKTKKGVLQGRITSAQARIKALETTTPRSTTDEHELKRLQGQVTGWQTDISGIDAQLPAIEAEDKELLDLYLRQKNGVTLSKDQLARLQVLQAKSGAGGVALTMGALTMEGVGTEAGKSTGKVEIGGISAVGTTNQVGMSFLNNPAIASAMGTGSTPAGKGPTTFNGDLQIERIKATDVNVGGSVPNYGALSQRKTNLEGVAEGERTAAMTRELANLQWQWTQKVKDGSTFGDVVKRLLLLDQKGEVALQQSPRDLAERERLKNLIRGEATHIDSIDVRGVAITAKGKNDSKSSDPNDAGPQTSSSSVAGEFGLSVGEIEASGIKAGGTEIKKITATDLSGSADLTLAIDGDRRTGQMKHGHMEAGSFKMEGIKTGGDVGTTIGEVSLTGVKIDASTVDEGGKIAIEAASIEAKGVSIPPKIDQMRSELARLEKELKDIEASKDPTAGALHKARITELMTQISDYEAMPGKIGALMGEIKSLTDQKKKAKTKPEKEKIGAILFAKEAELAALKKELEGLESSKKIAGTGAGPDVSLKDVKVSASGLGNVLDDQWELAGKVLDLNLHLGSLNLTSPFALASPSSRFEAKTAKLNTLDVGVKVRIDKKEPADGAGPGYKVTPILLERLDLASASATGLSLSMPVGEEVLDLEIPSATLSGVHADGIPLENFDPVTFTGNFHVDQAQASLKAKLGKDLQVSGKVNLTKRLSIAAVEGGGLSFDPGNVDVQDLKVKAGALGLTANLRGLQTKVDLNRETGALDVKGPIGTLSVANVNWNGGGRSVKMDSGALVGVEVDASVKLNPTVLQKKMRGEYPGEDELVKEFTLKSLTVQRVQGSGLHYKDADRTVDLVSGTLNKVKLTNYTLGKKGFHFSAGEKGEKGSKAVKIDGLNIVQGGLSANVDATVDSITVDGLNDGTIDAKIDGVNANAKLKQDGKDLATVTLGGEPGKGGNASFKMTPDGKMTFGVGVPSLAVAGVDYVGQTEDGKALDVKIKKATLEGANVNAGVLIPPGTDKTARTISVDLNVQTTRMAVNDVYIGYGDLGIDMKQGALNGFRIGKPGTAGKPGQSLHVDIEQTAPDAKGERKSKLKGLTGSVGMSGASLSDVEAAIPGILQGRGGASVGAMDIDFLSKDEMKYSLQWLKLHPTDAVVNKVWRLSGPNVSVSNLSVTGNNGGPAISGSNGPTGSKVNIAHVEGQIDASKTGGQLDATAATKGSSPTGRFDIDLSTVSNMNGAIMVKLPGGFVIPIPFDNGHLLFDPNRMKMPELPGIFSWMPASAYYELVKLVVNGIAGWLDKKLSIQRIAEDQIEGIMNQATPPKGAEDAVTLQQTLDKAIRDNFALGLGLDAFATGGKGLGRTIVDEGENLMFRLFDKVTGWDVADHHREELTQERIKTLRQWIDQVGLGGGLGCAGPFEGQFIPNDKAKPATNFGGKADLGLSLSGTLGTSLDAKLKAGVTGLWLVSGGTTVKVKKINTGVDLSMQDKKNTLGGKVGVGFSVDEIDIESKK